MLTSEQIAWHSSQFAEPKRNTAKLEEFVKRVAGGDSPSDVLDAGTGAGANMLHLADVFPTAHWTGIDLHEELLEIGREYLDPACFTLRQSDMLRLEKDFGPKCFDVSLTILTLSWLDDYELAVEQLLAVTKKRLFILSLFSDSALDAFIRVVDRMKGPEKHLAGPHEGLDGRYNIYSLPRFREFLKQRGAKEIVAEPYEIDIDLPQPDHKGMGTWTERMADGRRLQLSGPLWMQWWFVAIGL